LTATRHRCESDQISAEAGIVGGKQVPDQIHGGVLIGFPINPAGVAQVDQEADDDGLFAIVAEESEALLLAFVEHLEILGLEVDHEAPLSSVTVDGEV